MATRRGKQFNSMVQADIDPLTDAGRDAVFIDDADADALALAEGDPVVLRSDVGEYHGRVKRVRLARRSLQVLWPEGNVLIPGGAAHREPGTQVPDYNAIVTLEREGAC